MKYAVFFSLVAMSLNAGAGLVWVDENHNVIERPNSIVGTANPTDEQLEENGIRQVTSPGVERRFWVWGGDGFESIPQGEIETILAAEAEANAEAQAEAEAHAELPMQSATGFAALDDDGHWVELLPTGDGLPIIGVQVSNSPLTAEQRAQMKAQRKATHDALKAEAKAAKNDKDKIALLMRAVFGKDAQ